MQIKISITTLEIIQHIEFYSTWVSVRPDPYQKTTRGPTDRYVATVKGVICPVSKRTPNPRPKPQITGNSSQLKFPHPQGNKAKIADEFD
ncbi:hypothetical protein GWI33_004377 [Rhynchophorus ferrugineus]|uniref:Uncharacterized protein n=1 Tax=Rhynchophorus ferrugineus TaxID=354439 RepID=A0A834MP55_RHYFE|nr:hypothetical protein GWI33_004377 [Rhynchophorus ferrugineus]